MKQFFIGIDVSKLKFNVCVYCEGQQLLSSWYDNSATGVKQMLKTVVQLAGFTLDAAVFCMEETGYYCNHLLEGLHKQEAIIWLENPAKIKSSNKLSRGKSDDLDAYTIAVYAFKHQSDLKRWAPKRAVMQQLKYLFTVRNRLVAHKSSLRVSVKEAQGYINKQLARMELRLMKDALKGIDKSLKNTEEQISLLIRSDESINHQFKLLTNVESIGKVTALYMIITTNEFKDFTCPKKFACYSGVAPFEHSSGTSIRGKTRVSHYANKTMKGLLHLAAMSSVSHSEEMKSYYRRKVEEGKNKMSVLNAIRNKLIGRMFAVIRDNKIYEKRSEMLLLKS